MTEQMQAFIKVIGESTKKELIVGEKQLVSIAEYSDIVEEWKRRGASKLSYDIERNDIALESKRGCKKVGLVYNGALVVRTWE